MLIEPIQKEQNMYYMYIFVFPISVSLRSTYKNILQNVLVLNSFVLAFNTTNSTCIWHYIDTCVYNNYDCLFIFRGVSCRIIIWCIFLVWMDLTNPSPNIESLSYIQKWTNVMKASNEYDRSIKQSNTNENDDDKSINSDDEFCVIDLNATTMCHWNGYSWLLAVWSHILRARLCLLSPLW